MTENWLRNRVKKLNEIGINTGEYILYWMQSSQRAEYNQALEYAIHEANKRNQPLLVYFGLTDYPEANTRYYQFMLEGLAETSETLWEKGAQFKLEHADPAGGCLRYAEKASLVVLDRGYQKSQRKWYKSITEKCSAPIIQVESDAVIPVETAADKELYMAVHLRNRIKKITPNYLVESPSQEVDNTNSVTEPEKLDVDGLLKKLDVEYLDSGYLKGGRSEAIRLYTEFVDDKIEAYADQRNDPNEDKQSHMSPYLHFGQVSPIELALRIKDNTDHGAHEYREQLIVRRELAFNMVFYNPDYENMNCLPDWSKNTLREHASDSRPYIYTRNELENAETHDSYWNKAQHEMTKTGKMHGYMRMYWGKKILEWGRTPEEAYENAVYLNNKYELDGRSCNGYTGVAWCFGKHDQAWKERPIYGKVRYMNDKGLERKYDMKKYLASGFNI